VNVRHLIPFALIALLMAAFASSQTYSSFPGGVTDSKTLRVQERVEELYLSGDYDRAYFIYRRELAPKGDKYAQYMIGYMHVTGAGVPEDPVAALAWYRLAAERGEPSIELARNELQVTLTAGQIAQANEQFAELRGELSDRVLIYALVKDDLELLRDSTVRGSSTTSSNMLVIDRRGGYMSGDHYYQIIRNRLDARLSYLKSQVEIIDVADAESSELAEIESEIEALFAEIDKR